MTTAAHPDDKRTNWVRSRVANTSDSLDRAFEQGLTGHVLVERDGKRVRLQDGAEVIEFVSCSYLGLEQHPALVAAAREALDRFGVHFSIARNRAQPDYLGQLEDLLSQIYQGATVVAFGTVSTVHLGVLPLLGAGLLPSYPVADAGAAFLIERTAHASMQVLRGILEQIGPVRRFDMADDDALPAQLREVTASGLTPIVLIDGVGSMGGLTQVVGVREQVYRAGGHLYIDDAHGTSIIGEHGAGYAFDAFGDRLPSNTVIACSLSKAFGGIGACVLVPGPADGRMLIKSANPLVFGQSIPLPVLAATVAAARLHLNGEVAGRQQALWRNAAEFDRLTGGTLVNAGLRCPIRGAQFATEDEAFEVAARLRAAGVIILPAFFPTVAKGTGLIRFALSSLHDQHQLAIAAKALGSVT